MKQRLKRLLVHLLSLLPGKPVILLESAPPLGDNTGALYRELLAQGWNDRYRLIWVVPDPAAFRHVHEKNVGFVGTHGKWALMRLFALRARAAAIVDCNGQIQTLRPETVHLYLTHGSPLKSVHDYYFCDPTTDWALSQAPFFDAVNSYEFHIPQDKLVTLGFPRNDELFTQKCDLKDIFGAEFDRFVVWYPTYRQHKNDLVTTTDISIPVIHDPAAAEAVNAAARETGTLVIVKPHPAQDLAHIRALELSNLRFIDDGLFAAHGITSYEFLACTDALITDYSSVLFDYLLTGKPVGLTFEDIDAYARQPGFAIDPQPLRESAAMLDTPDDFRTFFAQLASGDDPLRTKRLQLSLIHI